MPSSSCEESVSVQATQRGDRTMNARYWLAGLATLAGLAMAGSVRADDTIRLNLPSNKAAPSTITIADVIDDVDDDNGAAGDGDTILVGRGGGFGRGGGGFRGGW